MRKYAWIYVIITVVLAIWGVRYFTNRHVQTSVVRIAQHEDSVSASGVIVRNETVYTAETGGSLQSQVSDETRVAKGKKIASLYTDGIDSALKAELDGINDKISRLEASTSQTQVFGNDIATVETRVKSGVNELVDASVSNDLSNLAVVAKELSELSGAQSEMSGDKSPRQNALNELYTKRKETEGRIQSAKKDIYSKAAGVYISGVDGCENILTPDAVKNMGPEQFNGLNIPKRSETKEHYSAGETICKTVDNGIWYAAAVVNADSVYGLSAGKSLKIRMPELDGTAVNGQVEYISENSGGQALVMVSSRQYIKGVYSERCVKLDLIMNTYYGIEIPMSAVRVSGEDTGVFVNTDGVARFKKVNILYKNNDIAIVEKSEQNDRLRLYDPVIVNGSSVEAGEIIN